MHIARNGTIHNRKESKQEYRDRQTRNAERAERRDRPVKAAVVAVAIGFMLGLGDS